MIAEGDRLNVAEEIPMTLFLKNDHVEETVVQSGILKKRERSAVKTAISDEDEAAVTGRAIDGDDTNLGWASRGHLRERHEVADRAKRSFEFRGGLADHFGIQTGPGQLDEILPIGTGKIDLADVSVCDDPPSGGQIVGRQAQLGGEDIHRSHRKNPESHALIGGWAKANPIDDLVDGSVSTGGHNDPEAIRDPLLGGYAGIIHPFRPVNDDPTRQGGNALLPISRPTAVGGRIEDHEYLFFTLHIP